jgi:hypothetical protein
MTFPLTQREMTRASLEQRFPEPFGLGASGSSLAPMMHAHLFVLRRPFSLVRSLHGQPERAYLVRPCAQGPPCEMRHAHAFQMTSLCPCGSRSTRMQPDPRGTHTAQIQTHACRHCSAGSALRNLLVDLPWSCVRLHFSRSRCGRGSLTRAFPPRLSLVAHSPLRHLLLRCSCLS